MMITVEQITSSILRKSWRIHIIAVLVLTGCSGTDPHEAIIGQTQYSYSPPVTILLDGRPMAKTSVLQSTTRILKEEIHATQSSRIEGSRLRFPPKTTFASQPISSFTHFGTEQGLALSIIAAGLVDRLGNLWFGTAGGGVSRFDGTNFTTFTTLHGLAHNTVRSIVEDKTGNIWFGTNGGGLSRYDGTSFVTFTAEDGLTHNMVRALTVDSRGNLWIGTEGGGASRYDGRSFTTFSIDQGLPHSAVWSIVEDKRGNLWFGTGAGLSRFDGNSFTTFTEKDGLADEIVRCVVEDKRGQLWIGTNGGVSVYDGKRFTTISTTQGLVHNLVRSIVEDKGGNLWFGTDGGLSRYDGKTFINLTTRQGLRHNAIRTITEDKKGNLWFGTEGGGVSRYDGTNITTYTTAQGLAFDIIRCIVEDGQGNMWFATQGGGINRYDGKNFTTFTIEQGLASDEVWSIAKDKGGNLWFGTANSGLSHYDGRAFTSYTTEHGLASNSVRAIIEDRNGNLWFGTEGGGVSRYDGKNFTTFSTKDGLAHNDVRSIAEDRKGNLWFSTNGGGISQFDGKSFTTYTKEQGLPSNVVWSIEEDMSGSLWFGTGSGACRFDGKSFTTYTTVQGLSDDVVYDIVENEQGVLWFGTNAGISGLKFNSLVEGLGSEVKGAGLLNVSNEVLSTMNPVWDIYNVKTGYPVKSINLNAMCISKKGLPLGEHKGVGIIWSGCGDNKVIRFDPAVTTINTDKPQVFVQAVKIADTRMNWYGLGQWQKDSTILAQQESMIFGRLLRPTEREEIHEKFEGLQFDTLSQIHHLPQNLVLPYRDNQVSFDFGVIETGRNFLVQYQYILEGYDKGWSPATEKTSVTYGNIHEGSYEFKLKSRSPEGVWSDPVVYNFAVLPPWWRSWWAYTLYVVTFAIMIWMTRRQVIKRERLNNEVKLKKLEAEKYHELDALKSRFFTNISHEFRTPLTLIKGPVQNILDRYKDDPKLQEQLKLVQRNSDLLLKLINQLLDLAKLESGTMKIEKSESDFHSFVRAIASSFESLAHQKNLILHLDVPRDRCVSLFDRDKLETILINLINNAIKFTPSGGNVYVQANSSNDAVTIEVRDTGVGIPIEHQQKVFERFHQVSEAHKEIGTGIGLSLAKELVELMGGTIVLTSEPGKGSNFTITLPVVVTKTLDDDLDADDNDVKIEDASTAFVEMDIVSEENIRPRVLVVEDNEDLRKFIIESLGQEFKFLEASTGVEGMSVAFDEIPDLIISDVMMPEMDGITMAVQIKADHRSSHIPIILLTAKSTEDSKLQGLKSGADDYLTKPFNRDELLFKIRNSISRQIKLREKLRADLLGTAPKVEVQSDVERFLISVKDKILERLSDEDLSVESLAEDIGISQTQLYRKVSGLTGLSVNQLIRKLRLQRAAQLIAQKWGPVSQVAYEVGFSNLSYFSKVFKEEFGMVPSEYSRADK
ncbi:MAG TPA: two-component regulator propeller domain-containing protein [Chryseolinea sp.]|nr:two-component regulator propeller domain-containing protein [Chryseolinea sp.]